MHGYCKDKKGAMCTCMYTCVRAPFSPLQSPCTTIASPGTSMKQKVAICIGRWRTREVLGLLQLVGTDWQAQAQTRWPWGEGGRDDGGGHQRASEGMRVSAAAKPCHNAFDPWAPCTLPRHRRGACTLTYPPLPSPHQPQPLAHSPQPHKEIGYPRPAVRFRRLRPRPHRGPRCPIPHHCVLLPYPSFTCTLPHSQEPNVLATLTMPPGPPEMFVNVAVV